MATKPPIADSRWAVDGSDVDATNIATPSGSQRDSGWVLNQVPPSSVENYLQNRHYRWFQYLSDGALSGDHSIAGDTSIAGSSLTITPTVFTVSGGLCTITAHGRRTGDGPFHVSNNGGALPTGLSAGIDYWLIVANANVFQFASSFANAIASINVALSTDGTGTQTLSSTGSTLGVHDLAVNRHATVGGDVTIGGVATANVAFKGTGTRTAAPSTGFHTAGEIVFNADPISGGFIGWVCVTSGSPGTWKSWGAIS